MMPVCTYRKVRPRPVTVIHLVHALEGGGTERRLVELLETFDLSRRRHMVVTQRQAGRLAARLPPRVACHPLQSAGRDRGAGLRLARAIYERRPAILHARNVGTWADALAARALVPGTRLVLGFHGLEAGGTIPARFCRLARLASFLGARFTSVSVAGRDQLVREARVRPAAIDVLPNGLRLDGYRNVSPEIRSSTRREWGLTDGQLALGAVGTLSPVKNTSLLIAAMSELDRRGVDAVLVLIGDGPQRRALESLADALGLRARVRILGLREEVPACLSGLDLFVSASRSEGMSNALLEAMAAGCAIVATDVGDARLMLDDGAAGRLVPPDDVEALVEALHALTADVEWRRRLAAHAQRRARDFDLAQAAARYERFYESLVRRGSRIGDWDRT